MAGRIQRALVFSVVSVALVWLSWGFLAEAHRAYDIHARGNPPPAAPTGWRWGTPAVERFSKVIRRLDKAVPEDEKRIGFLSPVAPGGESNFFRYLWASYLLPHRDLIIARGEAARRDARYWLLFGKRIDEPWARLVFEFRAGAVYEVSPP